MDYSPPDYSQEGQKLLQPGYAPPQPRDAPSPKTGYPPQQPGYPPQQPGYPPQGEGYALQPMGYSSQSTNNTTAVVQNQPQPEVVTGVIPAVNDHMGLSKFACRCCCWPIGIFAIQKSSEARNRFAAGDYAGALASAKTARNLSIAAIICGCIIILLIIVLQVVVFAVITSN